jgi:large subunit ribosomal protein L29
MSKKIDFLKSLAGMNVQDLQARLEDDVQRMKKLQFAHGISPLENPMSLRDLRREIARLKSELKKKEPSA